MLETLEKIFETMQIADSASTSIKVHSNTSKEQGLFLQELFDKVKPIKTLEVGLAYGISALFILEKHREYLNPPKSHIIIEPYPWNGVAEFNINNEKLSELVEYFYEKSDDVLPKLYYKKEKIQFAYIDTTKIFDTVLQDFYFLDKILDVNGIIILDDCGGGWPGVQKVARFINTLPHYELFRQHGKVNHSCKKSIVHFLVTSLIGIIPFKSIIFPTISFKSDQQLGLDYSCIAFKKTSEDKRNWNWDVSF